MANLMPMQDDTQVITDWAPLLMSLVKSICQCRHHRTQPVEGKTFCPDCGAGVVFQWILYRCSECTHTRPMIRRGVGAMPTTRCCTFCGAASACRAYPLENPHYYQLRKAVLMPVLVEESPLSTKELWQDWWQRLSHAVVLGHTWVQSPIRT